MSRRQIAARRDPVQTCRRVAAANDPATFSSSVSAYRQVPNSLDPPEHTAFRAIVDPFFTPERMRAFEPRLRARSREIVAALSGRPVIEAIAEIGYPIAVAAQADWLGWHGAEEELIDWMRENHAATRSADRSRLSAVASAFDDIVSAEVRRRREAGDAAPQDPTTELLHACVNGQMLSDADVVSILRNWTAGDLGSIAAALGVAIHFLATHPDVQDSLRANPIGLPAAIDEMLRIDDPLLVNRRVVTTTTHIGGYELQQGTRVYLNWTSANRDETVFGDPDAYRPEANAANNIVYGTGVHACPGRPLATLELVVAVETLLSSTARIELAPGMAPERETYPVGGWRRLPVRLHWTMPQHA